MTPTYKKIDGSEVPQGHCVMPDHRMTTFSITLRTLDAVSAERLRRLLETQFECIGMEKTGELIIVK